MAYEDYCVYCFDDSVVAFASDGSGVCRPCYFELTDRGEEE